MDDGHLIQSSPWPSLLGDGVGSRAALGGRRVGATVVEPAPRRVSTRDRRCRPSPPSCWSRSWWACPPCGPRPGTRRSSNKALGARPDLRCSGTPRRRPTTPTSWRTWARSSTSWGARRRVLRLHQQPRLVLLPARPRPHHALLPREHGRTGVRPGGPGRGSSRRIRPALVAFDAPIGLPAGTVCPTRSATSREPVPAGRVDPGPLDARRPLHAAQRPARRPARRPELTQEPRTTDLYFPRQGLQLGLRPQLPGVAGDGALGLGGNGSVAAGPSDRRRGLGDRPRGR